MNQTKLNDLNIILASKSPRRQELLKGMDLSFEIITKDVDESFPVDMPLVDVAEFLCSKKAAAFDAAELPENFLLITADTIVIVEDKILNKPADRSEAIEMLMQLSGRWHKVVTGISLRCIKKNRVFHEISEVKFGELNQSEIEWYVDKYQPFDKAGAYGIQEWIGYIAIEAVKGSFYNVMGLPTHRLYMEIKAFICE
jgi:septum formation protein